jgi:DNA-binding MarR family transcriptional regulator
MQESRMKSRRTPDRRAAVDALMSFAGSLKGISSKGTDDVWASLDLSMAQLKAFMIVVHTGGLPTRALAEKMKVGPSAVTPVVDRLAAQKLVKREDDAKDRRVIWVRPTTKATQLHEKLLEASRRNLERVVDTLPANKIDLVTEALELLSTAAKNLAAEYEGKAA